LRTMQNKRYTISAIPKGMISLLWKPIGIIYTFLSAMMLQTGFLTLHHLYESTSKAKVNGFGFIRLLPPPKGSGFPPMGFYMNGEIFIRRMAESLYDTCQKISKIEL